MKGAALLKKNDDDIETPEPKIIHEIVNPRWEVCITVSESGFQQCSFVNSIATTKVSCLFSYIYKNWTSINPCGATPGKFRDKRNLLSDQSRNIPGLYIPQDF